ncbi:putative gamma-glutamylcyclotransferase CG2811 isoform X4 [Apis mellifera]|uniref:Gamma-glutamylcyclotransferase family protein n=1 Tax=Apis mellifera TaxID=7460 RepID=A0A7M7R907_APIME|nr:putative gamma-glutamylcyclotransferase CG2811 isoform X4 [Apis mellifera]|eukprot:XP_623476.1 putative gamma-glutamylcyclotransferase CG2811 isoform X4 [Apis mellifera]
MLFHIAAAAVLTNIAFLEIYTLYDLPKIEDISFLSNKNPLQRVFVYGTLKRGEPNHCLIQDTENGYAKFLGLGRTTIPYPLIIATDYNIPFLLKKPGFGHHVFGEVYDVDSKMLKKLDELEEHPAFYKRSEENVLFAPESKVKSMDKFEEVSTLIKVWIYFLPKFKTSLLEKPMYSSYSNEGSHGLKYCENEESTIRPEDLF